LFLATGDQATEVMLKEFEGATRNSPTRNSIASSDEINRRGSAL
jgi:hypothetical protein